MSANNIQTGHGPELAGAAGGGDWMRAIWLESQRREWIGLLGLLRWYRAMDRLRSVGFPMRWGNKP